MKPSVFIACLCSLFLIAGLFSLDNKPIQSDVSAATLEVPVTAVAEPATMPAPPVPATPPAAAKIIAVSADCCPSGQCGVARSRSVAIKKEITRETAVLSEGVVRGQRLGRVATAPIRVVRLGVFRLRR
jgi:hypothetical protein